jgi:hypothetical protein
VAITAGCRFTRAIPTQSYIYRYIRIVAVCAFVPFLLLSVLRIVANLVLIKFAFPLSAREIFSPDVEMPATALKYIVA